MRRGEMKQLFGIGYKGKIIAVGTLEELRAIDAKRKEGEHALLAPLAELSLEGFPPQRFFLFAVENAPFMDAELKRMLESLYCHENVYGPQKYGPFGDILFVTILDEGSDITSFFLSNIAQKAFPKPGLEADLVVIVDDGPGTHHFVGITRKYEPGKGKAATIGGFLDLKGPRLDSPLETVIHEGAEEAGVFISGPN